MIAPEWKILSETSSIQVDIFFLFKKQFTIIFISIVMATVMMSQSWWKHSYESELFWCDFF